MTAGPVIVEPVEMGTAAKRRPSTTAGLVSGYQRTNITTSGVSFVETTGGDLLVTELVALPLPIPFTIQPESKASRREKLKEGYRSMARENDLLAEDSLLVAEEVWPAWE